MGNDKEMFNAINAFKSMREHDDAIAQENATQFEAKRKEAREMKQYTNEQIEEMLMNYDNTLHELKEEGHTEENRQAYHLAKNKFQFFAPEIVRQQMDRIKELEEKLKPHWPCAECGKEIMFGKSFYGGEMYHFGCEPVGYRQQKRDEELQRTKDKAKRTMDDQFPNRG